MTSIKRVIKFLFGRICLSKEVEMTLCSTKLLRQGLTGRKAACAGNTAGVKPFSYNLGTVESTMTHRYTACTCIKVSRGT